MTTNNVSYSRDDRENALGRIDKQAMLEIMNGYFPGVTAGRDGLRAVWRGDNHAGSLSVFEHGDRTFYKDFATGQTGTLYQWLQEIAGLDWQEATRVICERSNIIPRDRHIKNRKVEPKIVIPPPATLVESMAKWRKQILLGIPKAGLGRGWTPAAAYGVGIGADGEDILYPVYGPHGNLLGVKRRYAVPRGKIRFQWEHTGANNPVGYSRDFFDTTGGVMIFEGEGKAYTVMMAQIHSPFLHDWGVVMMPGLGAKIDLTPLKRLNLPIYIFPDADKKGDSAAFKGTLGWQAQCAAAGLRSFVVETIGDACDVAHQSGLAGLARILEERVQ